VGGSATNVRSYVLRTLLGLGVAFAVVAVAGRLFRPQLEAVGRSFVGHFGLYGMALGTFVADAFSFPVPPWFYYVLSVASGAPAVPTLVVTCIASVLAANLAYAMAAQVAELRLFRARFLAVREKMAPFLARHGAWAVVLLGLLPLPFSITCYVCGSYRIGPRLFGLYVALRIPRLLAFYALVRLGWS
jgi:membrane protein YqaA with SNARE-associated domain